MRTKKKLGALNSGWDEYEKVARYAAAALRLIRRRGVCGYGNAWYEASRGSDWFAK